MSSSCPTCIEARAREIALAIYDDFALQVGAPFTHKHKPQWIDCMAAHVAAAVVEERERCAGVIEELDYPDGEYASRDWDDGFAAARRLGAKAIREGR